MCRTGGRRCDQKWDEAHRERYNARRRIVRNTEKMQRADTEGQAAKAEVYQALVTAAEAVDAHYSAQIAAHDAETSDEGRDAGPTAVSLAKWRASLTAAEREAHDDYGSILHEDLNAKLRVAGGGVPGDLTGDEQRMVRHLDAALARAPRAVAPYIVHRGIQTARVNVRGEPIGVSGPTWVAENTQPGQRVTFHAYTSTSLSAEQAAYFSGADGDYATSGVVFEIETTQGGNWGSEGPEAEVTLARNSTFEVVAVDLDHQINGKPYPMVQLREVAAQPRPDWADDEFTAKNGLTYYVVTEDKAITMRTADGAMAGYVNWGDNDVIGNMNVREEHQRRGLATALLRRARQQRPQLEHSDRLSDDARAWLTGIGEQQRGSG